MSGCLRGVIDKKEEAIAPLPHSLPPGEGDQFSFTSGHQDIAAFMHRTNAGYAPYSPPPATANPLGVRPVDDGVPAILAR